MATKSIFCSDINGGTCKNKVSELNGYICSAGHRFNMSKFEPDARLRLHLARNSMIPPDNFPLLVEDKYMTVRASVAQNPSLPEELQVAMAKKNDSYLSTYLAGNEGLCHEAQDILFQNQDINALYALAKNPCLEEDVAVRIASLKNKNVTMRLAQNPNISYKVAIEVLEQGEEPIFYFFKPAKELCQPQNLKLLNDYPNIVPGSYLTALTPPHTPDDFERNRENVIPVLLFSYAEYVKTDKRGSLAFKEKIFEMLKDDEEAISLLNSI